MAASLALPLGVVAAPAESEPAWYLHAGGVSHHLQATRAEGRQWREVHPGLGVEARHGDDTGLSIREAAGVLQDSRGFWGGYAGRGWMRRWSLGEGATVSAGGGAYAFYRSVSWSGRRAIVPALLPTASLDVPAWDLGVNLVAVPPLRTFGPDTVPAVMVQFVVRLR